MRKIIFFTFFLIIFFLSNAQVINRSDQLFGGSFSLSVFNINNSGPGYYNAGNVGVSPSYARAIKNNLTLGIRGSFGYNHSETSNLSGKTIRNYFNLGPGIFLRKYKLLKNRFGLYFNNELTANYNFEKERTTGFTGTLKSHSWGLSYAFQPGVFYKFSENFFGEGNIGGVMGTYYSNGDTRNFGLGASFFQYFNLGINYRIERKR